MIKQETLQNKLKEATLPLHRQIEANVFAKAVLQGNAPLEKYVQWLIKFYGFYRPLEIHIARLNFDLFKNINLKERLKTPLLYQDLKSLGQTDQGINYCPLCNDLPRFNDIPSLLGYLYVVEGSTLGGQFIVKKLKQRYGFDGDKGCRFFNGYGDKSAEKWNEFCCFLNEYTLDENQEKAVIQSACDTFDKLNLWFKKGAICGQQFPS